MSGGLVGGASFGGTVQDAMSGEGHVRLGVGRLRQHAWANHIGSPGEQESPSIAVDGENNPVLAGRLNGPVNFMGAVNVLGSASPSLFIATLADTSSGVALAGIVLGAAEGDLWVARH